MKLFLFGLGLVCLAISVTLMAKIVRVNDPDDWSGYVLITYAFIFAIGGALIGGRYN